MVCQAGRGTANVLDVQRLVHNWVRPQLGLGKRDLAMGYCDRPASMNEICSLSHPLKKPVRFYSHCCNSD